MSTPWRVGSKVALNVYEGDRPVCQCHSVSDAVRIVNAMNSIPERGQLLIDVMALGRNATQVRGSNGGKARALALDEESRAAIGRLGGETRAANMAPEDRSEAARKAVNARWAKVRAAKLKRKVRRPAK